MANDVKTTDGYGEAGASKSFSIEAEQAVLGGVLVDPACFPSVAMLLRPEYF